MPTYANKDFKNRLTNPIQTKLASQIKFDVPSSFELITLMLAWEAGPSTIVRFAAGS
jgi:hypothetical protein